MSEQAQDAAWGAVPHAQVDGVPVFTQEQVKDAQAWAIRVTATELTRKHLADRERIIGLVREHSSTRIFASNLEGCNGCDFQERWVEGLGWYTHTHHLLDVLEKDARVG